MLDSPLILIRAGALRDAAAVNCRPGAIALHGRTILAAGDSAEVRRQLPQPPDTTIDLPDTLILPAMVNAHAHLDLTTLGPQLYEGDFIQWIRGVMRDRPRSDAGITAAVERGLRLSREAGVAAIGDIAGSAAAVRARLRAGMDIAAAGISFLECFGLGAAGSAAVEAAKRQWGALDGEAAQRAGVNCAADSPRRVPLDWSFHVRVELQPHAPYSAGPALYRLAADLGSTPSTHLAETQAECELVRDATGPFADLLRQLGKWDASIRPRGCSPVQWLINEVGGRGWLLAHCNYVDDNDIALLASAGCSVAYCPVASDYFGHQHHRYRDMLAAGVNVCLGTDSILCQTACEAQPLGILAQMRHLHRRDAVSPATLLHMATVAGAKAMQLPPPTMAAGSVASLAAIQFDPADPTDPLEQILRGRNACEPLNKKLFHISPSRP
jgi:cytosine/adenosine deaminase-related metal-dependent hydrolase